MNINIDEQIDSLSNFFKVMGDNTRLKILVTLYNGELCVNDLATHLNMTQSAVSHQLKILRMSKLVKAKRDGRTIYYSLDDEHIATILAMTIEHLNEHK